MTTNTGPQPNAEVVLVLQRRCRLQVERRIALGLGSEEAWTVDPLADAVTRILLNNLADGRVARVLRAWTPVEPGRSPPTATAGDFSENDLAHLERWWPACVPYLDTYIARLIQFYGTEQPFIARLEACEPAAWDELAGLLARQAGAWLRQRGVETDQAAEAQEAAQEACEIIYRSAFHYDVHFMAWASVILNNILRQRYRRPDVLNQPGLTRLDEDMNADEGDHPPRHELVQDPGAIVTDPVEPRVWLDQALWQLKSRAQRYVLLASFYDGLDDDEIARQLGKSLNAVYILRYRALQRIKEILSGRAST